MRALIRLFKRLVVLALVCAVIFACFLVKDGHKLYEEALAEYSVEEVMGQIESQPNYTRISEVPQIYLNAVIATEDHRFYTHHGIDYIAVVRALVHNLQSGSLVEGGSTITQQLAKNQFFTQKKEIERKIAEVFMVREIEKRYSKDQILEFYINSIYYGEGFYNIYDASMGYFGKAPNYLTDGECTMLAGLPNAPSVYAITTNPDLAKQRQRQVLNDMVVWGYLTEQEADRIFEQS